MSVNRVEVDSDEDDNEQGDTNNQTQAGSETPEDSGGSEETSTESVSYTHLTLPTKLEV